MRINHEHHEQVQVVRFLNRQKELGNVVLFTANPRETYTGSFYQNNRNHAAGVRKGLPDLFILLPHHQLWIELKRKEKVKAKISVEQAMWINHLNTYPGVRAEVCYGATEAIKFISSFIPNVQATAQTDEERNQSVDDFNRFLNGISEM